jgi:transposase
MRPVRHVLRLLSEGKHSERQIALITGIARASVVNYRFRFAESGLTCQELEAIDDHDLELRLFPTAAYRGSSRFPLPDWTEVAIEMKKKGATLAVLHKEYLDRYPDGMRYSRYCELYREFARNRKISLGFEYRAGEACFVDFAGKTMTVTPPTEEPPFTAQIFVAVLGASGHVFVHAVRSQAIPDWLECNIQMFEAWGGATQSVVCDNLRAAVKRASMQDPEINSAYADCMSHYGVRVAPARPRKPKDKARGEQAVQHITRQVLFALRNRKFESLAEMNRSIGELVRRINLKQMRQYGVSRQYLFDTLEKPALAPLPRERWVHCEYLITQVGSDFHVKFGDQWYSVPYTCVGQKVEIRATVHTVEITLKGKRVASHARSFVSGAKTTNPQHYSPKHFDYMEWTPEAALAEAERISPACSALLGKIFEDETNRNHRMRIESGFKKILLAYEVSRVIMACERALASGCANLTHVRNLLRNNREALMPTEKMQSRAVTEHSNLRSSSEYALKLVHTGVSK